jgi:hypothetical protein
MPLAVWAGPLIDPRSFIFNIFLLTILCLIRSFVKFFIFDVVLSSNLQSRRFSVGFLPVYLRFRKCEMDYLLVRYIAFVVIVGYRLTAGCTEAGPGRRGERGLDDEETLMCRFRRFSGGGHDGWRVSGFRRAA